MNTNLNQNDTRNDYTEEISLQDLFMALWRQKILIIAVTLITALVAGIISMFVLKPVYHAKLNIIMNMPEIHHTKYGDYALPISTNEQYINLITSNDILSNTILDMEYNPGEITIESLRDRISITQTDSKNMVQNSFEIKVSAGNPEDARKLAHTLYRNYVEFLDVMVAEGATTYFSSYYGVELRALQVELESNKALLEKNIELLNDTPKTINQKEALDTILSPGNTTDFIIMENIINPNYTAVELDIINIKQTINSIESSMNQYNIYLDELAAKQAEIDKYYETGEFTELKSKIVRITKSNIYLPSDPVAPSRKTSPSNSKNIMIGALLGGMVSVLIAFIKEFWFKKDMK